MARRTVARGKVARRRPWVHTRPEQADQTIYIVEVLKLNGRWKPFRCSKPPFNIAAAMAVIQELKKESLILNAAWKEGRFRITPYQQVIIRWPDTHTEE